MSISISDILASVSVPSSKSTPHALIDLQLLTRHFVNEKCAPILLPYPADLISPIQTRLTEQITLIEDEIAAQSSDAKRGLAVVVLQTELERWKYILRAIVRCRIAKIDAHPHFYALPAQAPLLSPVETTYLEQHLALLSRHYNSSFLDGLPANLHRLDDTSGGTSMVKGPDLDTAVLARGLKDGEELRMEGTDILWRVRRGEIVGTRWRVVKEGVERGDIELL